eukprot:382988_1
MNKIKMISRKKSYSSQAFLVKLATSLCNGGNEVEVRYIFSEMEEQGILSSDPRLSDLHRTIDKVTTITKSELINIIPKNIEIFKKIFRQQLVVPNFHIFKQQIRTIYDEIKNNTKGKVADYIPQLAKANADHFGLSICTIDGQQLHIAAFDENFPVQSCCKIVNYCIALQQHGSAVVHKYVGKEPSGVEFNAITLDKNKLPHNPCLNAGAIMICSLIGRTTDDIDSCHKDNDNDDNDDSNDNNVNDSN